MRYPFFFGIAVAGVVQIWLAILSTAPSVKQKKARSAKFFLPAQRLETRLSRMRTRR
jgi:hypothetical protein